MARAKNTVHSCRLSLSSIRALLPAARLPRMLTRKRRNMVLEYYRYSFGAGIRESRKIRRGGRQPDDEEEEEGGRPSGVAAKPISSDSLFIFRRAYFQLSLCSVRAVLFTWHLLPHSCEAILREYNRATLLTRARQISRERNPLSCFCISPRTVYNKMYQIFGGL